MGGDPTKNDGQKNTHDTVNLQTQESGDARKKIDIARLDC